MFKAQRATYVALAWSLDVMALLVAFLAAWSMRDSLGNSLLWLGDAMHHSVKYLVRRPEDLSDTYRILLSPNPLVGLQRHLWLFFLVAPTWLLFIQAQGGYDVQSQRGSRQEFAICAYSGMLSTAVLAVFTLLAKFQGESRLLILGFLLTGSVFLWLERTVVLPWAQRRGHQAVRHVLIIGSQATAQRFAAILQTPAYRSSRLVGFIADQAPIAGVAIGATRPDITGLTTATGPGPGDDSHTEPTIQTLRYLGQISELVSVLDREVVDEVVMVRPHADAATRDHQSQATILWSDILELCLQRGRTVSIIEDVVPPVGAKVEAGMIGSLPTLVMHNTPQNTVALALKGLMDRVIAAVALLFLALPMAVIAAAVKLTSPGPVFFKQQRVGLNGRLFSFYKFRSMIVDAEKFKEEHPELFAELNTMSGPFFKSEDDPRITRVGRFLRKSSLDELPQFWNVLRGDMSLVGPRPPLPREVDQLQPWQRRKLSVKGGLTCLWQVSGRNNIDTDEWMRLDLEYIDNWSLWLDVKLLFKTLQVLVKPKGAS